MRRCSRCHREVEFIDLAHVSAKGDADVCGGCERREVEATKAAIIEALAREQWARFDASERAGVRFGMFPAWTHVELSTRLAEAGELTGADEARKHAVALMDCAKADGGMVA